MQYLLLIYRNEAQQSKMDPADYQKLLAEYSAYTQSIVQSGNFKAGDGAAADLDYDHRSRSRRQDTRDRRSVRRNPRATRRLLSRRGERPRRRDSNGGADSRSQGRIDRSQARDDLQMISFPDIE
ncbi:hypothetical protein ABIF79_006115 [Bradyrhizobium japonicum]